MNERYGEVEREIERMRERETSKVSESEHELSLFLRSLCLRRQSSLGFDLSLHLLPRLLHCITQLHYHWHSV